MQINKPYSFNSLASVIASLDFDGEDINLNREVLYFTDCDVSIDGFIRGYFDYQKETFSSPEYKDIKDVDISIVSVIVHGVNSEKIFTWVEKEQLAELVKESMVWNNDKL